MLHAQKNTLTCGGNATGTGGSVSYSIGQLDYINTTNTNGSISQGLQQVYKLNLNLKFFIEGYYAGASQMQSVLFNQGQVANANDADHVTIELHDATSPYNLIHSYTGIVKTDGTISCPFPNANEGESYYIVVKHRGALQTWSKNPVVLNSNVYDFTTNANKAFGDNQILVEPNVYAFYSGDLNQDENIDLLDLGILETDINDFAFGYYASDINGDGNVDLLDSPIIETNINGFVFAVHP